MSTVLMIWGAMAAVPVLIWLVFRSRGYKRQALDSPPGRDFQLTDERFVDPRTGETLSVWYSPRTGERAYVRSRSGIDPGKAA